MRNEQIFLSKNYTIIESGIPFVLRFNRKDSSASSAEDTIYMKSGWYIFDNNKLLPWEVEGVKNSPKYNAWIEYDETRLNDDVQIRWYTSWINPKSIESLNSDVYELDAVQFTDITDKINSIITLGNIRNDIIDSISADTSSIEENSTSIKNDVYDISLDVGEVVRLLGSLENGTVLNELEQIRTVLKSSATAGNNTPWGSIISKIDTAITKLTEFGVNKLYTGEEIYDINGLFVPVGEAWGLTPSGLSDPNFTDVKIVSVFISGNQRYINYVGGSYNGVPNLVNSCTYNDPTNVIGVFRKIR